MLSEEQKLVGIHAHFWGGLSVSNRGKLALPSFPPDEVGTKVSKQVQHCFSCKAAVADVGKQFSMSVVVKVLQKLLQVLVLWVYDEKWHFSQALTSRFKAH